MPLLESTRLEVPAAGKYLKRGTMNILLLAALCALTLILLPTIKRVAIQTVMIWHIEAAAKAGTSVDLAKATPFRWDAAYYIYSKDNLYTDMDQIAGVECRTVNDPSLYTLVFVRSNKCVAVIQDGPWNSRILFSDFPGQQWWGASFTSGDAKFLPGRSGAQDSYILTKQSS